MMLAVAISTNLALSVFGGILSLVGIAYVVWQKIPAMNWPARKVAGLSAPTPEEDRHTVLAIQGRLKESGNDKAAATAYTLLGEMLPGLPAREPERKKL